MNAKITFATSLALMLGGSFLAVATPVLQEIAINIDGAVDDNLNPSGGLSVLPGVTYNTFDPNTGLGSLTISVAGLGSHDLRVFFDHDLGALLDDETGSSNGSVGAGQSWEIDEPGYGAYSYFGNIYSNFSASTLDNLVFSGGSGTPNSVDDVALAMGWSFSGAANLVISLSQTAPGSGFYLRQNDGEESLYLSGVLTLLEPGTEVPEATAPLTAMVVGLAGLFASKYRRRR